MAELADQMQRVANAMQVSDGERAASEARIACRIARRLLTGTLKPICVDGNIYNWEGGAMHSYVTGGGGVEMFFTRYSTITAELLYHPVSNPTHSRVADFNPHFWTFAMGLKHYF